VPQGEAACAGAVKVVETVAVAMTARSGIPLKQRRPTLGVAAGLSMMAGLWATPAFAQRADGTYPSTLACDPAGGSAAVRASATVTIENSRATYEARVGGGRETGAGTLAGGRLTLSGKGPGYEARYAGEVSGRGGFLTGNHTGAGGKAFRRACQFVLGGG
jgi:hypothetical protein